MNNNNRKNIIPAMVMTTTMLSTVIATPAYAKEAYSTTALTQTMTTSSSYALEQFKSMLKEGILDVEMLNSINDSLSSLLSDIEKGKIDTYSDEFRNIVVSNTLAIDMIDNSEGNLSAVNGSLDDAYELLENSVWDNLDDLLLNIRFKDVKDSDWFNLELQSAAARGLIDGKGDGIFDPQGTLTVAEAIKLAASARAMYDDELDSLSVNLGNGHWADNYVSYAKSKGIVNGVSDLDKVITRDEMAKIFASALPTSEYEQINDTSLMPEKSVPSYVEKLFKAGIMIGDSEGFRLNDSITRAETACIINRVIIPHERVEADSSNAEDNKGNETSANQGTFTALPYYTEASQRPTYNPRTAYSADCSADAVKAFKGPINVLYNHTYNCATQEQYDAVMRVVNEAYDYVMQDFTLSEKTEKYFAKCVNNETSYEEREQHQYGYLFNRYMDEGTDVQYEVFKVVSIYGQINNYIKNNYWKQGAIDTNCTNDSAYCTIFNHAGSVCTGQGALAMAIWDVMGYNSAMYESEIRNHAAEAFEINGVWFVNWLSAWKTPEDTKAQFASDLNMWVKPTI